MEFKQFLSNGESKKQMIEVLFETFQENRED